MKGEVKRHRGLEARNMLKAQGVKVSRGVLKQMTRRFYQENGDILFKANQEQMVLKMKRLFTRRGWQFPPKTHVCQDVVDALNAYYGEGTCTYKKAKHEKRVDA